MSEIQNPPKLLREAVLFLVFNRPDTTKQVFEEIRKAKPPRLYVAADGPRSNREGEEQKVDKVREIATAVDWPCEVKTLFREKNLGCKCAVSSAINWFFEHEEQGIILEDDCLPHPDFFPYCETLLNRYKDDERVMAITGVNFQNGQERGEASYYFSIFNHVWGWASWRRAWEQYDVEMKFWPTWKKSMSWRNFWNDPAARRYWEKIFNRVYNGEIDTWDYQWTATAFRHRGLTATPNVNLVSNIGFGEDATHTKFTESADSAIPVHPMNKITHPPIVTQDKLADSYTFNYQLGGRSLKFPMSLRLLPKRLLGFVVRKIKKVFLQF